MCPRGNVDSTSYVRSLWHVICRFKWILERGLDGTGESATGDQEHALRRVIGTTASEQTDPGIYGEVLNVDVRTVRRWMRRYEDEGLDGLIDNASARSRACRNFIARRYARFSAKHFHEKARGSACS
jgi:hypothetical protein